MQVEYSDNLANTIQEVVQRSGTTPKDITQVFRWATGLADRYAAAAELAGPIVLVPDSCVLEDLRLEQHGSDQRNRPFRAAAFRLFCEFVAHGSDRPTTLGLSPVVIYEQLRRQIPVHTNDLRRTLENADALLQETGLLRRSIGFRDIEHLAEVLEAVRDDETQLVSLLGQTDSGHWGYDLSNPMGVTIPRSIAESVVADSFQLRYFDEWYVRFALVSRVEQRIIRDSPHPRARSLSSGDLSRLLAKLMRVTKGGWVAGLGDLDMLQLCDMRRQHQVSSPVVLLGQTVDDNLLRVLHHRHSLHVSTTINLTQPDAVAQAAATMVRSLSNPFKEESLRGDAMRAKALAFRETLFDLCRETQLRMRPE